MTGGTKMRFVVKPLDEKPARHGGIITMCALCSEDPRFCGPYF